MLPQCFQVKVSSTSSQLLILQRQGLFLDSQGKVRLRVADLPRRNRQKLPAQQSLQWLRKGMSQLRMLIISPRTQVALFRSNHRYLSLITALVRAKRIPGLLCPSKSITRETSNPSLKRQRITIYGMRNKIVARSCSSQIWLISKVQCL